MLYLKFIEKPMTSIRRWRYVQHESETRYEYMRGNIGSKFIKWITPRYKSQTWAEVWSDEEGCSEVGCRNQYETGTLEGNPTDDWHRSDSRGRRIDEERLIDRQAVGERGWIKDRNTYSRPRKRCVLEKRVRSFFFVFRKNPWRAFEGRVSINLACNGKDRIVQIEEIDSYRWFLLSLFLFAFWHIYACRQTLRVK